MLIAGLVVFACASAGFAIADDIGWLWAARFGQGVGAAAFSPAASALVARLTARHAYGRAFGSYGFYKSSDTPSARGWAGSSSPPAAWPPCSP